MAMYDNENTVSASFDLNYISEYLIQAQWAEFIELKKLITEISNKKKAPVTILDLGVGNARVPKHLSGIPEMWERIKFYDGTDNAQACVDISTSEIVRLSIADKVAAHFFDAANLAQWKKKHDLVICTWFTPGNFFPDDFSFAQYQSSGVRLNLSTNPKFTAIFKNAYNLLNAGGVLVLGACYFENDATRLKQEASYKKMGMTAITDEMDSFTATREGFWSQRFTKEKLLAYLPFAAPDKFTFIPLDTYDYAMQVQIKK